MACPGAILSPHRVRAQARQTKHRRILHMLRAGHWAKRGGRRLHQFWHVLSIEGRALTAGCAAKAYLRAPPKGFAAHSVTSHSRPAQTMGSDTGCGQQQCKSGGCSSEGPAAPPPPPPAAAGALPASGTHCMKCRKADAEGGSTGCGGGPCWHGTLELAYPAEKPTRRRCALHRHAPPPPHRPLQLIARGREPLCHLCLHDQLLGKVRNALRLHYLVQPGDIVALAFCGGPSSAVLLRFLAELRNPRSDRPERGKVRALHGEHGRLGSHCNMLQCCRAPVHRWLVERSWAGACRCTRRSAPTSCRNSAFSPSLSPPPGAIHSARAAH